MFNKIFGSVLFGAAVAAATTLVAQPAKADIGIFDEVNDTVRQELNEKKDEVGHKLRQQFENTTPDNVEVNPRVRPVPEINEDRIYNEEKINYEIQQPRRYNTNAEELRKREVEVEVYGESSGGTIGGSATIPIYRSYNLDLSTRLDVSHSFESNKFTANDGSETNVGLSLYGNYYPTIDGLNVKFGIGVTGEDTDEMRAVREIYVNPEYYVTRSGKTSFYVGADVINRDGGANFIDDGFNKSQAYVRATVGTADVKVGVTTQRSVQAEGSVNILGNAKLLASYKTGFDVDSPNDSNSDVDVDPQTTVALQIPVQKSLTAEVGYRDGGGYDLGQYTEGTGAYGKLMFNHKF